MNIETNVSFQTSYRLLQKLVDSAEQRCLGNLKDFDSRLVLIEGGGYEKIWLETQPMSGEMYAKRNMEAGLNNQLLFMECQREDGRIPGSIALIDGKIVPQFDKFQGFCFPSHAFNMYYLSGKNPEYLELLYRTLERFDRYLWKVRDSDGDGCLESWCKYDTGEDNALRYGDSPDYWIEEFPPRHSKIVPIASMDIMSFSFSSRETLSKISSLMGKTALAKDWKNKALSVRETMKDYLWDDAKGACFDRDKYHQVMNTLVHNNLRAMYWNSFSPYMAERFVTEHLLNKEEFWTAMPLPSVAVNDPLFRNTPTNDWSGQCEALTFQRAILALQNYGYDYLLPQLGEKLFQAIGEDFSFVQQYDPFTGKPSIADIPDSYGPAIVSVMEYAARMFGVHMEQDHIFWGTVGGHESIYEQTWGEKHFQIKNTGTHAEAFIDGKKVFKAGADLKVITDKKGNLIKTIPYREHADMTQIVSFT